MDVHILEVRGQNFKHSFEIVIKFFMGSLAFAKVERGLLFFHSDEFVGFVEYMENKLIGVHALI